MIFTPKGLSVSSLHLRISSRTTSGGAEAAPMMPKPPAFDTAAASLCSCRPGKWDIRFVEVP